MNPADDKADLEGAELLVKAMGADMFEVMDGYIAALGDDAPKPTDRISMRVPTLLKWYGGMLGWMAARNGDQDALRKASHLMKMARAADGGL